MANPNPESQPVISTAFPSGKTFANEKFINGHRVIYLTALYFITLGTEKSKTLIRAVNKHMQISHIPINAYMPPSLVLPEYELLRVYAYMSMYV